MSKQAYQLAENQHGVVTLRQLRRHGLTRKTIRHLTTSGQWREAGRGVLVRNGAPVTPHQRLLVAIFDVDARAVASHDSAAWLWG
ncbi:MAG: type IV toxin-antitoxin system AbiEi family antitoxin domain-containing protein, partial [Actinobacteria bacterium]|nr:type IV toxin-antitoxin system AbiEi family antitoxin domain-containing protein [Actinomycetota bacterium]